MARAALQSRVQRIEGDEHLSHLRDGVDAEVGARAVCGDAARLDLERDEPAVRDRQLQLRRLHHDRRVRVDALEHGLRSDGAELLVGDEGENDVAATIAAASAPFMSYAPRPYKRPSSTRGSSGPSMPPNPTVSKCPLSRSERPPPVPRRTATTLGRSSPTISVSRPWSSHQFATSAAASPSPRPPGTSDGLTESTETSRVARSTISSRRSTTRRLVLGDPEERRAGRRAPIPGGVDRDNAVAKLAAGELRRHPPTHLGIAGADEEPPRRDEGREQCVLLVHADDGSAPAAVVEQVEAQRGLLPALGVGGVRGDERLSDVGRFEVADCGEMLDRGR